MLAAVVPALALDLPETRQLYFSGKYDECAAATAAAMADGYHGEEWALLKMQSNLQTGKYAEALQTLDAALEEFPDSVRLRWLGHRVLLLNHSTERAEEVLREIGELSARSTYRYGDSANRVSLGEYYAARGADPRQVLETFFDPVKKDQPQLADAYIAAGELALSKSDFALAAEEFTAAQKRQPENPDIPCGLARAFAESDTKQANLHLQNALKINPRHTASLLMVVDNHIDAELYEEAEKVLQQVLEINPLKAEAWAYRAVLAHLRSDPEEEKESRAKALSTWSLNPQVDHLIGRKLSQKYRFAEGSQYQRQAIACDKFFLPAQLQLAQDLLRLGVEDEGWQRAELVFDADQYNVVAHNLVRLQANLAQFRTLENDHFVLRMDTHEAGIYGHRLLALLDRAKATLSEKYEMPIDEPVKVEVFPQQQDFAIRTFGLPGGDGFLGVCFGRVITANSPASQGDSPANLDSVLWHEFCHVVTLQKTRNRMPRWLSEGISVHEERVASPAWGQKMNLLYRQMILDGELTPVSKLSGAFLSPPSPLHLQFAYYEASLVVQYLVEKYGQDTLNRILTDLGVGMPMNESLQRYTGSIDALDQEFEQYARTLAQQFAPQATWEEVTLPPDASLDQWAAWIAQHPANLTGLRRYAQALIEAKQWEQASAAVAKLIELCPDDVGTGNPYELLTSISRAQGNGVREREALEHLAAVQDDACDVYLRLMDVGAAAGDWECVARNADRMLAVNPLVAAPHRFRAQAAQQLRDAPSALESYQALLELDPADPAELHYRWALQLREVGRDNEARRQTLMALEEAPRFRAAHELLLELVEESDSPASPPHGNASTPAAAGDPGAPDVPTAPGTPAAQERSGL